MWVSRWDGWIDPCGGWLGGRLWWLVDETLWGIAACLIEGLLACGVDGIYLAIVDLVWGHEADAGVVVVLVIPGEELAAEGLGILDATEPLRKSKCSRGWRCAA